MYVHVDNIASYILTPVRRYMHISFILINTACILVVSSNAYLYTKFKIIQTGPLDGEMTRVRFVPSDGEKEEVFNRFDIAILKSLYLMYHIDLHIREFHDVNSSYEHDLIQWVRG